MHFAVRRRVKDSMKGTALRIATIALVAWALSTFAMAQTPAHSIKIETLAKSTTSWGGTPYKTYPLGQPQITILKITLPANTTMKWHKHPFPNAGYILSGELTIEKEDGKKKQFVAGQAVTETVDSIHRGITGPDPAVLIVFYADTPGLPLSQ